MDPNRLVFKKIIRAFCAVEGHILPVNKLMQQTWGPRMSRMVCRGPTSGAASASRRTSSAVRYSRCTRFALALFFQSRASCLGASACHRDESELRTRVEFA